MAAFLELPVIDFENEMSQSLISYLVYFLFIAYFLVIFIISSNDESAMDFNKNTMYLLGIIIPLIVFASIIFSNMDRTHNVLFLTCITIFLSIFLFKSAIPSKDKIFNDIMLYFTGYSRQQTISDGTSFLVTLSLRFLLIMIIIVFLSIFFNLFLDGSWRQKGKLSVYVYAILFIPCLVSDYFNYLFNEVRTTPTVVFSLIFLEIFLIFIYFYVPTLLSKVVLSNSIQIVQNPMQLYTKKQVGRKEDFYNITKELTDIKKTFKSDEPTYMKNYSLSMWVTLNPPTFSEDTECMIIRLGSDEGTASDPDNPRVGSPYVGCKGSKLKVVFSNNVFQKEKAQEIDVNKTRAATTEINIPFQTWNFLVFNYHDNQVDLFINGKLEETKSLASFLPIYKNSQVFCVGSNSNLLHGAVCDVRVQSDMLTQTQISQTYNLLKLKNPPVNNIN